LVLAVRGVRLVLTTMEMRVLVLHSVLLLPQAVAMVVALVVQLLVALVALAVVVAMAVLAVQEH
jgi:hypothetical protein